ncbi:MAG: NAD-dependent epimerase/dehydratase family protein [Francisellaceae bacterium]
MLLITGVAGFIGFHVCRHYLERGVAVLGVDNINDYYDVDLKYARLRQLEDYSDFRFLRLDLADRQAVEQLFHDYRINRIIHLAAQAGVRHSIEKPMEYIDSNVVGFMTILEGARHHRVKHLVYASTSSVYGANSIRPFSEKQGVNHPLALYAATKRFDELAAHSYSSLYKLPTTGLRFFSVYGPWGRPDMALFKFTKNILEDKSIDVYNHGDMIRDFTYVDDIVEGVVRALEMIPLASDDWSEDELNTPDISYAPFRIYNIGNGKTIQLMEYIKAIEHHLGKKASLNFLPMQPGDVPAACADVSSLERNIGYKPKVDVLDGMKLFIDWYIKYYKYTIEKEPAV